MPEPEQIQMLARPKSIEQLRQLQRDLFELSKPFVRAKCDILARSLPSMIRYPDGRIEAIYDQETTDALAYWDALWKEQSDAILARNHFCTVNGLDLPEPTEADNE